MRFTTPDVIEALASALRSRESLDGVDVFTAHPGEYLPFTDAITFFGSEHHRTPADLQGDTDSYVVFGSTYSLRQGSDGDTVKATRERATELLDELANAIEADRHVGGLLVFADVSVAELNQGHDAGNRWCEIKFEIACEASPA